MLQSCQVDPKYESVLGVRDRILNLVLLMLTYRSFCFLHLFLIFSSSSPFYPEENKRGTTSMGEEYAPYRDQVKQGLEQ